jgi:hypothetical protein
MRGRGKVIRLPTAPAARRDELGLVEVRRCDQAEALVVKALLESERIPSVLRSRLAHSVHPFSVGDQGAVIVLVPASEAARSRRLLADRTDPAARLADGPDPITRLPR